MTKIVQYIQWCSLKKMARRDEKRPLISEEYSIGKVSLLSVDWYKPLGLPWFLLWCEILEETVVGQLNFPHLLPYPRTQASKERDSGHAVIFAVLRTIWRSLCLNCKAAELNQTEIDMFLNHHPLILVLQQNTVLINHSQTVYFRTIARSCWEVEKILLRTFPPDALDGIHLASVSLGIFRL